jgi:Tripartite tricarboxylate transporter family receptor
MRATDNPLRLYDARRPDHDGRRKVGLPHSVVHRIVLSVCCCRSGVPNGHRKNCGAVFTGGSTDVLGRILAQKLSEELNGTFMVENRAGGNTVTAANMVARSAPDGLAAKHSEF